MRITVLHLFLLFLIMITACTGQDQDNALGETEQKNEDVSIPEPEYFLTRDQTHNKFSSSIEPVLRVPSGAVIQAETEEATDAQLTEASNETDLLNVNFDLIHPLTGPVYVEDAQPGDVLAVTLHKIDIDGWGWTGIFPGFGFLPREFTEASLKTFKIDRSTSTIRFNNKFQVELKPFPGVMGVAPATDSLLSTIPPRANGGNMDNPYLGEGVTVYFPVLVEGGLFSIGDTHAAQGMGEVCGTAIEAPMTIIYSIELIKEFHSITEPQYENDDYFAVTAFASTLDEAAKKATGYMIDYLEEEHGLSRDDAYMLCSLAGELKIAEVVDVPNMLVAMHIDKSVLGIE